MKQVPDRKKLRREYLRKKRLIDGGFGTSFVFASAMEIVNPRVCKEDITGRRCDGCDQIATDSGGLADSRQGI